MKVFRDRFVEWLDAELAKITTKTSLRGEVLLEVKDKLHEIIAEEVAKMKNDNH